DGLRAYDRRVAADVAERAQGARAAGALRGATLRLCGEIADGWLLPGPWPCRRLTERVGHGPHAIPPRARARQQSITRRFQQPLPGGASLPPDDAVDRDVRGHAYRHPLHHAADAGGRGRLLSQRLWSARDFALARAAWAQPVLHPEAWPAHAARRAQRRLH